MFEKELLKMANKNHINCWKVCRFYAANYKQYDIGAELYEIMQRYEGELKNTKSVDGVIYEDGLWEDIRRHNLHAHMVNNL